MWTHRKQEYGAVCCNRSRSIQRWPHKWVPNLAWCFCKRNSREANCFSRPWSRNVIVERDGMPRPYRTSIRAGLLKTFNIVLLIICFLSFYLFVSSHFTSLCLGFEILTIKYVGKFRMSFALSFCLDKPMYQIVFSVANRHWTCTAHVQKQKEGRGGLC